MLKISNLAGFSAGVVGTPRLDRLLLESGDFLLLEDGVNHLALDTGASDFDFSNVVLLLSFDGSDGETTTVDASNSNHSITFVNQAQLDDAQKKFGTTSVIFDGINDYLSLSDSADWHFGTGQFTIEFWMQYNAFTGGGRPWMIGQMGQADGTQVWGIAGATATVEDTFVFHYHDGSLSTLTGTRAAGDFTFNTQYHIAVDRDASNVIRIYFDGVVSGSVTDNANIRNLVRPLRIGQREGTASGQENLDGWIDEVRITKGIARYAGAFTPSDNPFPTR